MYLDVPCRRHETAAVGAQQAIMGTNGISAVRKILCHYCDLQFMEPQRCAIPNVEPLPHLLTIDPHEEHLGVTQRHVRRLDPPKEGALLEMAEVY